VRVPSLRAMQSSGLQPVNVVPVPGEGAEDVLVGADGTVYTATEDGSVLAVSPDGDTIRRVVNTGGRPLGLEWLPDGRLLVCDADAGLLAIEVESRTVEVLVTEIDGVRMLLCDNAAVDDDGTIWFSDSSTVHPIERWRTDVGEDTHTGRLVRRSPDGDVTVLADGLRFANGVALAPDRSCVYVAETTGRTVLRHRLTGPDAGSTELFVGELPGYPDNLSIGTDGLLWVAIASPRLPVLERMLRAPLWARRLVLRLPEAVQPAPKQGSRVMAYDHDGRLVHDVALDGSAFHVVTGVREHHGRVWLGSLVAPAIAWFDL
jgi:sugar lactone lactonase YvrE